MEKTVSLFGLVRRNFRENDNDDLPLALTSSPAMAPTRQRKKLKSSSQPTTFSSAIAPSESPLARIATLEASLTEPSPRSLNPLADLLLLLTTSPEPEVVFKAVYACGRVLASLHEQGRLDAGKDDKEKVVVSWLRARREEFVIFCGGLLKDEEKDLRVSFFFIEPDLSGGGTNDLWREGKLTP
jgi:hypothetical protein